MQIGERFLKRGLLTKDQLDRVLEAQQQTGGRTGWLALSLGYITSRELLQILAEHYHLPFLENASEHANLVDISLIERVSYQEVLRYQTLPVRRVEDQLEVWTIYPGSESALTWIKDTYQTEQISVRVIGERDFFELVRRFWKVDLVKWAADGLFYRSPEESARERLGRSQRIVMSIALVVFIVVAWLFPTKVLLGSFLILQGIYLLQWVFKVWLTLGHKDVVLDLEPISRLPRSEWPVYSILVPLYREPEHVLRQSIEAIKNLDYPPNRLDVLLLVEEDDRQTIEYLKQCRPPGHFRFVYIPPLGPRTKPKACNYGLMFARGKYLTIYDAEDIPEHDQLYKALAGFQAWGDDTILQCALQFYNSRQNLLTRWFALEYANWFDILLPGLHGWRLPIPLGGTSNHFPVETLRQIGGWDAYNVTEDADLGMRAARYRIKVRMLPSTTWEEANSLLMNWLRQRVRWIKGYMQTTLVYTRRPVQMFKNFGFKQYGAFLLFVGSVRWTPLSRHFFGPF
ncbi:glycosyltransferase family 2 protein [Kyrpidia tusciae]|uniref:Glycosyl transferase family 2 n=1 Tax=Kyrpidia tusciae (strain DSM 2912 / NBRC 15312 / T2) TaxID=562970 RepID=D5WR70_KYRT2|nr:glycosyltransferase [Kyrpidia tusciae]ADG06800.1 glycosyl transferase family 2 [Kyrpidia tusciae DSM 2912]